jgi:recombination protein RecA
MDDAFAKNSEMGGALRAKVAGQCLRRINPLLRKHKAALLIVNQVRSKVGVMFGDPRTKAGGGKALLYYCSVSIETSSGKNDVLYDDLKNPMGIKGNIKCVKNKVTVPFQSCEFHLLYDKGLDRKFGLTKYALKKGQVTSPTSGWYALEGDSNKVRAAAMDGILADKVESGDIK